MSSEKIEFLVRIIHTRWRVIKCSPWLWWNRGPNARKVEERQRRVLQTYERIHRKHHLASRDSLLNLGTILQPRAKYDEAMALYLDGLGKYTQCSVPNMRQHFGSRRGSLTPVMFKETLIT